MIKGCNRRVIVVKHPESESFEEAYFIVREGKFKRKSDTASLVGEANRLINGESTPHFPKKPRLSRGFCAALSFVAGAVSSFLIFYNIM